MYYPPSSDEEQPVEPVQTSDEALPTVDESETAESWQSAEAVAEDTAVETPESSAPDSQQQPDDAAAENAVEPVSETVSRVEALTQAIERHPDAPVNYVLRGEVLLDGGDDELAAEDFEKALTLAEPGAETANWGYLNRALADRAREGLRQCRIKR